MEGQDERTTRVQETPHHHERELGGRQAAHEGGEHDHSDPAQAQVQEPGQHVEVDPVELRRDPDRGAGPHDREHDDPRRAVEHEQTERGVRAPDQYEDRRVIERAHALAPGLAPHPQVVRGAHAELGRERQPIDRRGDHRLGTGGRQDEHEPRRDGHEERDLVQATAEARLRPVGLGSLRSGTHLSRVRRRSPMLMSSCTVTADRR